PRLSRPMSTHEPLAARFARCVTLFREPGAREDQKAEFRALLGLLQDAAVSLRAAGGRLEINGIPCEGEGLTGLVQRLDLHGIGEIALPAAPPPPQLFQLFRALADQPGTDDIPSRLAAAGVDRLRVTLASPETSEAPPRRRPRRPRRPRGPSRPSLPQLPRIPRLPRLLLHPRHHPRARHAPRPLGRCHCRRAPPTSWPSSRATPPAPPWETCWRRWCTT